MATGGRSAIREESLFSKLHTALSKTFKKLTGTYDGQIRSGKTAVEMPALQLATLQKSVMASCTGPYGGLCQLDPEKDSPTHDRGIPVAGVVQWYRPKPQADGDSITLYEHKPGSTQHHGDPIADVFAVVARPNSCILVVADGVNWGIKPRLAARCAVHGSVDHLNNKLFDCPKLPGTTQDVFHDILRSFHSAQKMIIEHGGTTTTLCVAIVVELQDPKAGSRWGLCVVSVGDSLCYVWRSEEQVVFEVTSEMHSGKERNPRDCGGCLGCDLGDRPDLSNLICCFVPLSEDDIVFVTSDGIVDNLDPVILKDAVSVSQQSTPTTPSVAPTPFSLASMQQNSDLGSGGAVGTAAGGGAGIESDFSPSHLLSVTQSTSLPVVNPNERQQLLLEKLTQILRDKTAALNRKLNATDVKEALITHVIEATDEKRKFLEQCWTEMDKPDLTTSEKRANDRKIGQHIKLLPGKLDHATIAAYCVGKIVLTGGDDATRRAGGRAPTHSYTMNNVVESAEPRKAKSFSAGGSVFYSVASRKTGDRSPSRPARRRVGGMQRAYSEDVDVVINVDCEVEHGVEATQTGQTGQTGHTSQTGHLGLTPLARSQSEISPYRIRRTEALVSFPVCISSSTESYECLD